MTCTRADGDSLIPLFCFLGYLRCSTSRLCLILGLRIPKDRQNSSQSRVFLVLTGSLGWVASSPQTSNSGLSKAFWEWGRSVSSSRLKFPKVGVMSLILGALPEQRYILLKQEVF